MRRSRLYFDGAWLENVPVYQREALLPGTQLTGPAVIVEATVAPHAAGHEGLGHRQAGEQLLRGEGGLQCRHGGTVPGRELWPGGRRGRGCRALRRVCP